MPDIVIVTHQRATEVDGVIDSLREHGVSVERINLCQYPENASYSWTPKGDTFSSTALSGTVGWYHNPGRYTIVHNLAGHARELALRDCDAFWEGVALASPLAWLNTPAALILSSRKVFQISCARALNIPMPPTLVSNDPDATAAFFVEHDGAVVKSLANGYSVYGTDHLKCYARFFAVPSEDILLGLSFGPMIFQKYVAKQRELRVTVVDGQCFGMVANTSDLTGYNVDIRRLDYDAQKERFSGIVVPESVVRASRSLLNLIGLSYAGLDWVEDENGEWLFLELNCMGAFKWSEICGAGNITDAIAEALIKRVSARD